MDRQIDSPKPELRQPFALVPGSDQVSTAVEVIDDFEDRLIAFFG
jgi:hypothetical protein